MVDVKDKQEDAQAWSEDAVRKLADRSDENVFTAACIQESLIANLAAPE